MGVETFWGLGLRVQGVGVVVGANWEVGVIFFWMGLGLLGFRCFVLRPGCGFLQWAQSPLGLRFSRSGWFRFSGSSGSGREGFWGQRV